MGDSGTLHFLSQAFWFMVQPGNLLLLVLMIGAALSWLRRSTDGRIWLTAISAVLLLLTILPVYSWLARPLEDRFSSPKPLPEKVDGIIVLGGTVDAHKSDRTGQLALGGSAERITAAVELSFRYPMARLVITGREEGTRVLVQWLSVIGLPSARVEFETESRNTFENALFSRRLIQPDNNETWLVITTARHMPRAMGVFRKIDWRVIPYPVDYHTSDHGFLRARPDVAGSLSRIGAAVKEWIGLVAYYAMDRTDVLFPSPID